MAIELRDEEYVLIEGGAWFTIGNISVRLTNTDEGVVCDMYPLNNETSDSVASCYAFYSEMGEEISQ